MGHERTTHECETPVVQEGTVETPDRRLLNFLGKEEEGEKKHQEMTVEKPLLLLPSQALGWKEEEEGVTSSVRAAQSPAAPTPSDAVAIDQGVAYLLMFVALALTYIVH